MVLLSFSVPEHVALIMDGRKRQTTRIERKNPIKVGDTLQVYYKSRIPKYRCDGCIDSECLQSEYNSPKMEYDDPTKKQRTVSEHCDDWCNVFGTATVTSVTTLSKEIMDTSFLEWAQKDGFATRQETFEWFSKQYGDDWLNKNFVVIKFKGDWL
jgi:hypothetical protein